MFFNKTSFRQLRKILITTRRRQLPEGTITKIEEKGCEKEGTHSPKSEILKSILRTSRKPLGREGCQIVYIDYSVAIEIFT